MSAAPDQAELLRLAEELLELRDYHVTEAALREQLAACLKRQAKLRKRRLDALRGGEELVRGTYLHVLTETAGADIPWPVLWLTAASAPIRSLRVGLAKVYRPQARAAQREEEELREALHDLLGQERRPLTPDEEAFVDRFGAHVYATSETPPLPTAALPGDPEKLIALEMRAVFRMALFPLDDFRPPDISDQEEREPIQAEGNYAKLIGGIGHSRPVVARKYRREETPAEKCQRWVREWKQSRGGSEDADHDED